ncbi:MAG: amidase [Myxococcota bacterium]
MRKTAAFLYPVLCLLSIGCGTAAAPATTTKAAPKTVEAPFRFNEVTVAELQRRMESGGLRAEALVEAYLEQIEKLNPKLNAVISLLPDAVAVARALDEERASQGPRGPLHGIPIIIKDNIAVVGVPNTAGSSALAGVPVTEDAPLVTALREAGAVILGKANLSEWANFRGRRSSSGWSAVGGQTRNPYVLDRTPCGSSSGSGVVVAANLTVLAIGTETDGSIVCPSAINGIVGLKPTVGAISGDGVVPISFTQDTAGPMARTVADVAAAFAALTSSAETLSPMPLNGIRLGVATNLASFTPGAEREFNATLDALRAAGAELVDVKLESPDGEKELKVLLHELAPTMEKYLAKYAPTAPVKSVDDLIRWNREHPEELRWYGQEWFEASVETGGIADPAYIKARNQNVAAARSMIDSVLADNRIVAILAPTRAAAWPIDTLHGDRALGGSSTTSAVAGYPILTLPMGFVEELPVGISLIGTADSEWRLLNVGASIEEARSVRKPPKMLPTLIP